MAHYINFYFKNLIYDDDYYLGTFTSPDDKILCEFEYLLTYLYMNFRLGGY